MRILTQILFLINDIALLLKKLFKNNSRTKTLNVLCVNSSSFDFCSTILPIKNQCSSTNCSKISRPFVFLIKTGAGQRNIKIVTQVAKFPITSFVSILFFFVFSKFLLYYKNSFVSLIVSVKWGEYSFSWAVDYPKMYMLIAQRNEPNASGRLKQG